MARRTLSLAVLAVVPLLAATEGSRGGGSDVGQGAGRPGQQGVSSGLSLDERLDVGRRGSLGDEVVLRVQAAAPDFWRAGSCSPSAMALTAPVTASPLRRPFFLTMPSGT